MADITLCKDKTCPHKERCYRFNAEPSLYQAYFINSPRKGDKCFYYWGENAKEIWNEDSSNNNAE